MRRLPVLGAALGAVLFLLAACGDDGGEGETEPDPVDTTLADEGDEGDEGGDAAPAGLCERLALEDVSAATGLPLDEVGPQFSQMTGNDVEVTASGCSFEGEGDADVEVVVLDDGQDPAEAFQVLLDQSASSTFDDFAHAEVGGLGDGAFFQAGLRQEQLTVRSGGTVLFVEGTGADGETLGRAELQAVAELALDALG
jgi:hypothetical protein